MIRVLSVVLYFRCCMVVDVCGGAVVRKRFLFHLAFSIGFDGKTKGETMGSLTCLVIVFIGLIIYCYNSCGS